uniref:hypothetical protein n=1 Tax=Pseudomonas syringae TaxID=317 RepID=UPI001E3C6293|nr:hypothetical protein [Pseudomonas syringae]QOQ33364.1 hypothetical protein [Pseudomonas syringae pv. actinidiae]
MKNWSFGKLIGVFAGCFLLIIIIAVVIMKASSSPVKRVPTPSTQFQQPEQKTQVDVLALQLEASQKDAKKALDAQVQSQQQVMIVRDEMRRNNQLMINQFAQMNAQLNDMKQRVDSMDARRNTVEIIKPPRKVATPSANEIMAHNSKAVPESSGYKVQATVGNRAWIKSGDREDSVKPGEKLPPVQRDLRIKAIDNESGIVITGPAR